MINPKLPEPKVTQFMLKPTGSVCNLKCSYCYYLDTAKQYSASSAMMSTEVLESFFRQYLELPQQDTASICWQGGEPTLQNLSFYKDAVAIQRKYLRPGKKLFNSLQTNATRLDEKWCEFLRAHKFLTGISIDGPKELHNAYRKDKQGAESFEGAIKGLTLLKRHSVDYNIIATVNAATVKEPLRVYRFFRDELKAKFIQFIPVVQPENNISKVTAKHSKPAAGRLTTKLIAESITGKEYGEFLVKIFDEWLVSDTSDISIQIIDVFLNYLLGLSPNLCVFDHTCGSALVLEHNGDLYTCDHFVNQDNLIGNILETPLSEILKIEQLKDFGRAKHDLCSMCRSCNVAYICQGGCPKNRILELEGETQRLNYLCEGYKRFFTHAEPELYKLASSCVFTNAQELAKQLGQ